MIRLLHVDDNDADRELIKANLLRVAEELVIDEAPSAKAALAICGSSEIDCILSDFQMPVMNGLQLLKTLREGGDRKPFIFLTGQGNEEVAAEALRSGANDYYTKEIGFAFYERLFNSIRNLVSAHRRMIEHERAERELEERRARLALLSSISTQIRLGMSVNQIIEHTLDQIRLHFPDLRITYATVQDTGLISCSHSLQPEGMASLQGYLFDLHEIPDVYHDLKQMKAVIVQDVRSDLRFRHLLDQILENGFHAFIRVPIRHYGGFVGILGLCSPQPRTWSEHEIQTSREVADYLALALQDAHQQEARLKAEEALRESEGRYGAMFESHHMVMLLIDSETGRIVDANPAACAFYGYDAPEMLEQNIIEINTLPEAEVISEMEKAKSGKCGHFFFKHRLAGGEIRNVEVFSGPLKVKGRLLLYSIVHDITERKRAEDELHEKEEFLKATLEATADGILAVDEFGRVTHFNQRFLELWRIPLAIAETRDDEQLLDHVMDQLSDPRAFRRLVEELYQSMEDSIDTIEFKDGRIFERYSRPLLREGRPAGRLWSFRDVSERRKFEEKLRLSDEILRNVGNLVLVADGEGSIVYASDSIKAVLGYEPDEVLGDGWWRLSRDDPAAGERERNLVAGFARGELTVPEEAEEKEVRRRDGERRWILWRDSHGPKNRVIGVGIDITERKRAEEELRKSRDLLAEKTELLGSMNRELESLAYMVSHELQGLMWRIENLISLLSSDYSERFDEEGRKFLRMLASNSRDMRRLIDDLREFSNVTRRELLPQRVNLSDLAQGVFEGLRNESPGRHVEFKLRQDLRARGDPMLLRLLLENLLGNAWKFTSRRGRSVIELGAATRGGRKVFYIRDNGVGFQQSQAEELFVPFRRLHAEEDFPGTGIGLATVRRIVHRHGGRIWAEGEPGKGAAFYFSLG